MEKTFKIAISNRNILGKNGASRIILQQANRFKAKGAEVYLYASRFNKSIMPSGIKVKHFFSLNLIKQQRREQFARKFKDFCNQLHIDLSIGNGDTFDQNILFMHNLIELEAKLVNPLEDLSKNNAFLIHEKILKEKRFDLLICNSYLMKNFIQEKYNISDNDISVIYPGYDPQRFNSINKLNFKNEFKQKYKIKKEYIVGFVTSGNLKNAVWMAFLRCF